MPLLSRRQLEFAIAWLVTALSLRATYGPTGPEPWAAMGPTWSGVQAEATQDVTKTKGSPMAQKVSSWRDRRTTRQIPNRRRAAVASMGEPLSPRAAASFSPVDTLSSIFPPGAGAAGVHSRTQASAARTFLFRISRPADAVVLSSGEKASSSSSFDAGVLALAPLLILNAFLATGIHKRQEDPIGRVKRSPVNCRESRATARRRHALEQHHATEASRGGGHKAQAVMRSAACVQTRRQQRWKY